MKPVKLSELIEALEFDFEEISAFVDLENGCVVMVQRSVLSDVEEGDEEALSDVPDWEKDEVEIARAIRNFEPRIIGDTLFVRAVRESSKNSPSTLVRPAKTSTPAQEMTNSAALLRTKILTMLARMMPIRPMKRKLRQALRSRLVVLA